ncbi:GIY-YIG nuclease family protein [Yokenella regensburgei]|uniref:GIY-YIG nuclease family protein n=1 Tax=Yokenella regensburgei TaxID=158877 RepID=UPI00289C5F3D|nr:GIY-YIG nuclease family protein [Yokenella regensburgei]
MAHQILSHKHHSALSHKGVAGVYQITNTVTGEAYIGSTVNISGRWSSHRCKLKKGCHGNRNLQASWDKYGSSCFVLSVLQIVSDKSELIPAEQSFFDLLNPVFNIAPNAGNSLGVKHTEESKANMGDSHRGEKNFWYGKVPACATKPRSQAFRDDMSKRHSGKGNPMSGVTPPHAKFTDEQVRDIRRAISEGDSLTTIAKRYGVSKANIAHIRQGRSYARVV